jgi:hypothetical protein
MARLILIVDKFGGGNGRRAAWRVDVALFERLGSGVRVLGFAGVRYHATTARRIDEGEDVAG